MLYFAYGSNLDWDQMRGRCPSAKFCAIAVLPDHRLAFTRRSKCRDCGVADVVPAKGHNVWGVVYEISEQDIGSLDKSEGYRPGRAENAYDRREHKVFKSDDEQSALRVLIYFANQQENPPLPNQEYKDQILKGARFWQLPRGYIRDVLEPIKVCLE